MVDFAPMDRALYEDDSEAVAALAERALTAGIEHVQLETDPNFFGLFAEGCLFRPQHDDPVR